MSGQMVAIGGLDECAIGTVTNMEDQEVLIYDLQKVIDLLKARGSSAEEAMDWVEYTLEQVEPRHRPMFCYIDAGLPAHLKKSRGMLH